MSVPRFSSGGRFDPACLFRPNSVAVLGTDTEAGGQIMANLLMGGFKGEIRTEPAPGTELAVLAVAPDRIGAEMERLARNNCFAAIIPGPCENLAELSDRTGVRALGPHSFGIAVPRIGLNATRAHIPLPPGRLAVVSQSSSLSRAVIDWAGPNGVGFSHMVGIGGNAGLGFSVALDWLSRDSGTGAILLDIRRIKNNRMFLSAARAAARLRPVVAIRPGLQLEPNDGDAELSFEAALRRAGVLYVRQFEDLLAAAETLSRARPARTDALVIVSNALDPARLAADSVLRGGLLLAPDGVRVVETGDLPSTAFRLAADAAAGGVLVVHAPISGSDSALEAFCHPPADLRAPLLICAMGEMVGAAQRAMLARAGLPVFAMPHQAVQGFAHLVQDRRNREAARELPPRTVLSLAPNRARVQQILDQAGPSLTQEQALEVLAAYGVPIVATRLAASATEAAEAARQIGFPVVVKLRTVMAPSARPPRGLVLDLHDPQSVSAAADRLLLEANPAPLGPPLLVQRQMGRSRELCIHVADDATFGPCIAFGGGGTLPSPLDVAVDLPPLNLALARALMARSPAGARLGATLRDRAAGNEEAVAETLVRVSQLIIDFPQIAELRVPSLFSDPNGVAAADAWLRLRSSGERPPRLAIAPYPDELIEHRSFGFRRLTIRPIRPEDAEAHRALFARLSPQDIRFRFFSAMRELSAEQTARLTQVDYDREMAFIAVDEATGETVGVSRLVREADRISGEFAVIVQADMKGQGLASHLMRRLLGWAADQGLKRVVGQILADNAPMLAFIRHLGFTLHRMPDDPEVMEAELELPAASG